MNVNNIMDLGGSQSTSKTRSAKSTTKSQAASSDLFKSIMGQKQAGGQKQSGLDVQGAAAKQPAQQTQGKDTAVQDTSSKDSAPATGNDSTPADNLDSSAAEDAAVQDTVSSEPAGDRPVTEDEAAVAEEPVAEDADEPVAEEAEAPQQIFIMQMPVAAAAAPMAPVIISNETYQPSTVEAIVNDIVLDQPQTQPQVLMQVSEAQISVGQNQVEVQSAEFTVLADVQEAAAQGPAPEVAAVEIAATLGEMQTEPAAERPAAMPQAGTPAEAAPAEQARDVEQEVPVRTEEMQTAERAPETQGSAQTQETVPTTAHAAQSTDAADEFAAQVVREARDMVQEAGSEAPQEVRAETDEPLQTVSANAEADDTDDGGRGSEQQKSASAQHTMAPGTAPVAEDGRVDLRANAAQPLEAEHYLQPETRQMIMNRVVDQVRSAVTPDRTEFYIQLKPDFLGGLSIGLVAEEKGIVAKIMTTSQQVHSALQADMSALQRVLQERGINVVEMDVIYNQMTDASSKDNSDNRQQQFSEGGNSRSHGRISDQTDDSMTMYDTLSSYDVLTENGGSVEYTA